MNVSVKMKRNGSYDLILPNCKISETFARISGSANLTRPVVDAMKSLGIVFEVVQEARTV